MCIGQGGEASALPPQACRPPSPSLNLSHASALPHGVPTSCLHAHSCTFGA